MLGRHVDAYVHAADRAAWGWDEADSSEGEIVAGRQRSHDSDSADDDTSALAAGSFWSQAPEEEQPGQPSCNSGIANERTEASPPASSQASVVGQDGPPAVAAMDETSRTALITEMAVAIHTALQTSGVHEDTVRQRATALRRRLHESQDDTGPTSTSAASSMRSAAQCAQERLEALPQDIQRPLRVVIEALQIGRIRERSEQPKPGPMATHAVDC